MSEATGALDGLGTDRMLASVGDGVGWITFNNPSRLNAVSVEMNRAIPVILSAFEADPSVGVVVVAGAGGRAFVSGADISEFGDKRTSVDARAEYDRTAAEASHAWAGVTKPIVAMIGGFCMGGGVLTAMQADIRIASENSRFAIPAARLGLGYAFSGVQSLMALVGPAWAAEILFSGRHLSAEEACRIGLVNRVVAADELEPSVRELAATIRSNAPLTIKAAKAAIRNALRAPADRDLGRVDQLIEDCFLSEDYREGQRAFMEKRPPHFVGH